MGLSCYSPPGTARRSVNHRGCTAAFYWAGEMKTMKIKDDTESNLALRLGRQQSQAENRLGSCFSDVVTYSLNASFPNHDLTLKTRVTSFPPRSGPGHKPTNPAHPRCNTKKMK